jgi:hypothetical protein
MDFISRKPSENSDPLASRPETRPVKLPPHIEKAPSVADQIPPKGAHAHIEKAPASKPEPEITIKKDTEKAFISREPATSRDLYAEPIDPDKSKTTIESSKSTDRLAMRASFTLSSDSKKEKLASSSDGNTHPADKKSPFLPHYTVDKRPLSDSVPDRRKEGQFEKLSYLGVGEQGSDFAHKNVYEKADESSEPRLDTKGYEEPVKIIDGKKKKHGMPTWLIILITIILGAGVGAGVYFLLPK